MTQHKHLPEQIRGFLFDLDGTLVETSNRWGDLLGERLLLLQRVCPSLDAKALGRRLALMLEMPMNYGVVMVERLGITPVLDRLGDSLRRSRGVATRDGGIRIEGTGELLQHMSERYKLAIVTTRARREAEAILTNTGLAPFFQVIVTRHDTRLIKPHPAPVLLAAQRLGLRPEECVMVGDTASDMRSAKRAGAHRVGVLTGLANQEELERAGAELILERASELLEYVVQTKDLAAPAEI